MSSEQVMELPERLRSMADAVARNDLSGATTRRLIELDMREAADRLSTPANLVTVPASELRAMREKIERLRADSGWLRTKARAVLDAFKAHGLAHGVADSLVTRRNCENAILAVDAALATQTGEKG